MLKLSCSPVDPKATIPSTNCCGKSFPSIPFALMMARRAETVLRVTYDRFRSRGVMLFNSLAASSIYFHFAPWRRRWRSN
jgi:hypothetical protein